MNQIPSAAINIIIILKTMCLFLCSFYLCDDVRGTTINRSGCDDNLLVHRYVIEMFYERRKNWRTSNLGAILFKNVGPDIFRRSSSNRENRKFVVLVWRHGNAMQKPSANSKNKLTTSQATNHLDGCSVKNCMFTENKSYSYSADAILVNMQKGIIPQVKNRNPKQRWVFLSVESPKNTFLSCDRPTMAKMANIFNWTMTYRSDSDVPIPYGRTISLPAPAIKNNFYENDLLPDLIPNWNIKRYDIPITVLMSNCIKHRLRLINELKKYIPIDVYRHCGFEKEKIKGCPGGFRTDCKVISHYIFYLALENSRCRQYISEKVFHNAYLKGAIPVIQGPPLDDCEKLLPPNSFIHVDKYKSPEELAKHLKRIISNPILLLSYHRWRNHFRTEYEHGYFGGKSRDYCRLCEALNYNDGETSIYDEDNLSLFFDPNITCT